jgi:hypothetical protein
LCVCVYVYVYQVLHLLKISLIEITGFILRSVYTSIDGLYYNNLAIFP